MKAMDIVLHILVGLVLFSQTGFAQLDSNWCATKPSAINWETPSQPVLQGTTYTLKILLVEFPNVAHRSPGYTYANFNNLFFSSGEYVSPNMYSPDGKQVFGSMRDYFSVMSDGDFDLNGYILNTDANGDSVPDWVMLPKRKGQYDSAGYAYWNPFLDDAFAAANALGLDISTGSTTKLAIIYAGNTYINGGLNPQGGYYNLHHLYINGEKFAAGGPHDRERSDAYFSEIGINAHEFAHLLNIPDLSVNGHWDLMNGGPVLGPDMRGACPAPLNPLVRSLRGWIALQDLTEDHSFQADYYLRDPEVYKIRNGSDPSNYWLIETRSFNATMLIGNTTAPDYNAYLDSWFTNGPAQGVLVWRVSSGSSWGAILHADGKPWPTFPNISAGDVFPGGGNVKVLSPWSDSRNPSPYVWVPNTKPSSNVGMEVTSEGTGYYLLDLYYQHPENASPSKPQNLQGNKNAELAVTLSWNANADPHMLTGGTYNIYRAYYYAGCPTPAYIKINASPVTSPSFVDNDFSGVTVPAGTSVSLRYRITAVDNTSKESVRSDSSEITYTASEFGRALGYQGRSDNPGATAFNSQRKLYLDFEGNLHVVFQSGGEVFYRKSTDNGVTWQITKQLSDGSGTNASPSITGRWDDGKECTRLYCVWQKGTSSNYSVVYNYSSTSGTSWLTSPVTLASSINCSGPTPVIQANGPDVSPELMISWKDASQLKAAYTTSKTPGPSSWNPITNVANTNSSSQNPTLLWQPTVYPYWHLAWDANGTIYSESYSSGSWFTLVSFCPPYGGHTLPSIAVNGNNDIHLFWHGLGTFYHPSIIGNKNLNPGVFTAFMDDSKSYFGASVTGHSGGRASLLWYDSQNNIDKVIYDGSNWSSISSIASSGKYVTTSITNNPGGSAWAMWTSTSGPPYALLKGPANPLSKTPAENGPNMIAGLKYSRELAIRDTSTGATLVLEVDEPQILNPDGSVSRIPFATVDDAVHYATPDLVKLLQTQAVILPSSQSTIRLKRSLCVNLAGQSLPATLNTMVAFEIVSSTTGSVLSSQTVPVPESEAQNTVDSLVQFIVSGPQAGVKFRVQLTGTLSNQARAYLLHVYSPDTSNGSLQREGPAQLATGVPSETRLLQNYPNPFNPTTRIQYQLAEDSHVALRLYDILGREVRTLMEGEQQAGYYEVTLDGTQLASGIYLARMVVTDQLGKTKFTGLTKLILMK
jgi:M6 family metalloprotease-like protein